jgi:hypothetical protein
MRRSDPERIYLAKLAGLRNRIRDTWRWLSTGPMSCSQPGTRKRRLANS